MMLGKVLDPWKRLTSFNGTASEDAGRLKLGMQRKRSAPLAREFAALSDEIVLECEDWVRSLVDYGHGVSIEGGKIQAFRALALHDGTLFWLVRKEGKARGYHSERSDPFDAIRQAEAAWQERKRIRENWLSVEKLAHDLLLGRRHLRVRIEDAHDSPLCSIGITSFMRRMRLSRVTEISGRLASILMWFDPQVGFVIHQASLRERQRALNSTIAAPVASR